MVRTMATSAGAVGTCKRSFVAMCAAGHVRVRQNRLWKVLLVLSTCSIAGAIECYVGVVNGRVFDTTQKAVECSKTIYGDPAACAVACARNKKDNSDVCSFLCIPGQHCDESFRVHPISDVSPGLFLPGCPPQENFEPVGNAEYDCNSQCCTQNHCNANAALQTRTRIKEGIFLAAGIAAWLLAAI